MITDKMMKYFQKILDGKAKKDPQKYSGYKIRARKRIDHLLENAQWFAENFPDQMRDLEYELNNPNVPMKRRAKALLRLVATFESESTVIKLINELFPAHTIELVRKKKE